MKKKIIGIAKFLIFLGIGVVLFWYVYKDTNTEDLYNQVSNLKIVPIILCLLVSVLSHYVRGIRWRLLIIPVGYQVNRLNSFNAVVSGYLANLAIPRMGEVSRCVYLNRTDKVPVNTLLGTVVAERIFDVIALFLLLALVLILQFKILYGYINENIFLPLGDKMQIFGSSTIWIILFVLVILGIGTVLLLRKLKNNPLIKKITDLLVGFKNGLLSVLKMKNIGRFIFYTIAMWGLYFLQTYLIVLAMESIAPIGISGALAVFVLGSFGFVVPVQGGIGAYHLIVASVLTIYGIEDANGVAFAGVSHTFQMLIFIVLGAIAFIVLPFRSKKEVVNQ